MMWELDGLIAAAGLASLTFWYHYWRRRTEPDYRLPTTSRMGLVLAGTWAVWTIAAHYSREWIVLLMAIFACHIVIFICYGVGSS